MAESVVQVTEGSGKKLHTFNRTIGANSIEDGVYLPGEHYLPTYSVLAANQSIATSSSHVLQIMAGSSLHVRIRRIRIEQAGNAGAVANLFLELWRLTTAGTGGTSVTARPFDTSDSAAGATGMTLPTVKGTESVQLYRWKVPLRAAVSGNAEHIVEWVHQTDTKPIIIPAGTTNGLAFKVNTGIATATVDLMVEFVETSFL